MLRLFAPLLFGCLLSSTTYAQTDGVFNIGLGGWAVVGTDAFIDKDGNHVVIVEADGQVHIVFLNPQFQVQWNKQIGTAGVVGAGRITQLSNGMFVALTHMDQNSDSRVVYFTGDGTILKNKRLIDFAAHDLVELSDGNILFVGERNLQPCLFILNQQAEQVAEKTTSSFQGRYVSVIKTNDGKLAVLGRIGYYLELVKFEEDLSILFSKKYALDQTTMAFSAGLCQTTNGDFYATGTSSSGFNTDMIVVYRFDQTGTMLKAKAYGSSFGNSGGDIVEVSQNEVMVIGGSRATSICGQTLTVLRLNQELDTVYAKCYGDSVNPTAAFYSQLHRNGDRYYMAGWGTHWSSVGTIDAHYLATNEWFDLPCSRFFFPINVYDQELWPETNSSYSFFAETMELIDFSTSNVVYFQSRDACEHLLENDESDPLSAVTLSPNPGSEFVTIHLGNHSQLNVDIYDQTGRLCYSQFVDPITNTVNLSSLTSGLYNVVLKTGHRQKVIKLIHE